MILDGRTVWTGSWNYTVNGTYRNNNNALVLDSDWAAAAYQAEFDEMFDRGEFGTRSRDDGIVNFTGADGEVSLIFAAEADEISALKAEIAGAARSIHIMTFVFSLEEWRRRFCCSGARSPCRPSIFEKRNSNHKMEPTAALQLRGAEMRPGWQPLSLHHKVIIMMSDSDTGSSTSPNARRETMTRTS